MHVWVWKRKVLNIFARKDGSTSSSAKFLLSGIMVFLNIARAMLLNIYVNSAGRSNEK